MIRFFLTLAVAVTFFLVGCKAAKPAAADSGPAAPMVVDPAATADAGSSAANPVVMPPAAVVVPAAAAPAAPATVTPAPKKP